MGLIQGYIGYATSSNCPLPPSAPSCAPPAPPPPPPSPADPPADKQTSVINSLFQPFLLPITAKQFISRSGKKFPLKKKPRITKPLGKDILIMDVETRPLDDAGKVLNRHLPDIEEVPYDTMGRLDHYMYARIHGYDYKLMQLIEGDLKAQWAKVIAMDKALRDYKVVVFIDADALWSYPHVPVEWLMNHWGMTDETVIALPDDVSGGWEDVYGNRGMNTGFCITQQAPSTRDLFERWITCPDETRYPECSKYKEDGLKEQSAFIDFIRHDYNGSEIVTIPCTEAMGYPGQKEGDGECTGDFVQHFTTWKDGVGTAVQHSVMQYFMERVHKQFHGEFNDIVVDELHSQPKTYSETPYS
ncbi:hypothetical protein NUU61_009430 [Penicillium alfredii]|uniref:Nucleotide-diphospho-sugar transferase domain-containing protein n=1 Tax=Penicillium alfredii TaxID=1506179 RepID=A0A9W9END0_9EURO|nr:uncharacterized protein NUU61_009430 [Penicillium alfredii]KAJ5084851.1 hypothetical protein NUU61_009430 [Penicillium alfredii]